VVFLCGFSPENEQKLRAAIVSALPPLPVRVLLSIAPGLVCFVPGVCCRCWFCWCGSVGRCPGSFCGGFIWLCGRFSVGVLLVYWVEVFGLSWAVLRAVERDRVRFSIIKCFLDGSIIQAFS